MSDSRKHRPDIDGLRGVAVLAVILNHLRFLRSEGGFVGVDIFFVLSGYLVGSSLIDDFQHSTFSLVGFYERRARRILPALYVVLAVTSLWAYRYLTPAALVSYSRSLIAAVFSFSNFFFWHQGGYFDAASSSKPLLHTWSLAVEEQFYLFFPLMLLVIFRWFPARLRAILWVTAIVSFLGALWAVSSNTATAFFWSPLRAWELLAGTIASQQAWSYLRARWARELTANAGLLLVLCACLLFTPLTPFPGAAAFVPCLGAVMILAAGQVEETVAGRLLSLPPMTFLGIISYSLYLWHWPLFVFQKNALMLTSRPFLERNTKVVVLVSSFVCAVLSWRFVEVPFRKGRLRPERKSLFWISGAGAAMLLCGGVWLIGSRGVPSRFSAESLKLAQFEDHDTPSAWRLGACFIVPPDSFENYRLDECLSTVPNRKQYLLYGDSAAAQLYPGLSAVFPEIHFQQATSAECLPYRNASDQTSVRGQFKINCQDMWTYIHSTYLKRCHPDAIILAGRWNAAGLTRLGNEVRDIQSYGIAVIVIGPGLAFDMPLPTLLTAEMRQQNSEAVRSERLSSHTNSNRPLDQLMSHLARTDWHVRYISYYQDLCLLPTGIEAKTSWRTRQGCELITNTGEPLTFDDNHLSVAGSLFFAHILRQQGQLL